MLSDDCEKILSTKMKKNDAGAETIGDYLALLLLTLWEDPEAFSGKRPFGNSGWTYELALPLVKAGLVKGDLYEEEGEVYLDDVDNEHLDVTIKACISKTFLNNSL